MKYRLIIIFLIIASCTHNLNNINSKIPFNSKGFAYLYSDSDYLNKNIKIKMDNNLLQIAHNKLKPGSLIKVTNLDTNDSIILKNSKKIIFPDFYKILITNAVAKEINLKKDLPLVEVLEINKNKSFIAKKSKIYTEEKNIHSKAPVELVKIDNIAKIKKSKNSKKKELYIVVAEFYSKDSAFSLKKRIIKELIKFDSNKLIVKVKKTNKISLLSGPYSSINLLKNDYIHLKTFGFEELDITFGE